MTEDWRYRMITPPKGNYAGVPLNDAARKIADNWDPAKDEAAGAQCKAYGAANIMRVPARIRISWADDDALKLEEDSLHGKRQLSQRDLDVLADRHAQVASAAKQHFKGPHRPEGYDGQKRIIAADNALLF